MVIIDKQGGIVKIRIARGSVDDPFISLETLLHFCGLDPDAIIEPGRRLYP